MYCSACVKGAFKVLSLCASSRRCQCFSYYVHYSPQQHPLCSPPTHNTKDPFLKMSSPCEAAKTFVDLRVAKKNDEAKQHLADDCVWTVPTMTGSDTKTGKDNVAAFWVEQDKSLPTVVSIDDFEPTGDNAAVRKMVIKKMMMKINLTQTITFNSDMKVVSSVTAKA